MTRASKIVTLVLLGSSLTGIGWYFYTHWHDIFDRDGTGRTGHSSGYHGGSGFWFGGGGGSSSGSAPASGGATSRGGFGATGVGTGG